MPALAGNRTRASRVAGENSTTETPMPLLKNQGVRRVRFTPKYCAASAICVKSLKEKAQYTKLICALAGHRTTTAYHKRSMTTQCAFHLSIVLNQQFGFKIEKEHPKSKYPKYPKSS